MPKQKNLRIFSLALVASLYFFGCDKNPSTLSQSSTDHGSLTVSFVAQQGSPFRTIAKSAMARVSAPNMDTIKQPLTITDSTVSGTVSKIPAGDNRRFEIFVYDSAKTIRYYGSTDTTVYGGQETFVYMTLRPYYGTGDAYLSGSIEDSIGPGPRPFSIMFTSPQNGQTFNIGDSIAINVAVNDTFGYDNGASIKYVDFYRDSLKLGRVSAAPFTWIIRKATADTFYIHTIAVSTNNDTAISQYYLVMVRKYIPNKIPIVSITSPANGAVFNAGDIITITAAARDSDGFVQGVQFLVDSNFAGYDSLAPYQFQITGLSAGTHRLQAIAFDDKFATGSSAIVTITVKGSVPNKPPVISIIYPANNSTVYLGDSLTVMASASDPDGYVRSVKFYRDSTLLVSDTSMPYVWAKVNPATGIYRIHAVATDNSGASTTSSIVTVTVLGTRKP
ncbi:MAG: Ig-like domain-containing protein [Chitinivibrionales bacterium]